MFYTISLAHPSSFEPATTLLLQESLIVGNIIVTLVFLPAQNALPAPVITITLIYGSRSRSIQMSPKSLCKSASVAFADSGLFIVTNAIPNPLINHPSPRIDHCNGSNLFLYPQQGGSCTRAFASSLRLVLILGIDFLWFLRETQKKKNANKEKNAK